MIRRILAAAKESTNFDSSGSIGRWKQKFKIRNLLHRREAVWVLIYVINHGHSRPSSHPLKRSCGIMMPELEDFALKMSLLAGVFVVVSLFVSHYFKRDLTVRPFLSYLRYP